ncbi:MAG: IPT/TIG domain-containing protein [Chloroflexi bacterium]|nr:IPT/TIG domain-containing protein [Chloroflexota bacterium]
MSHHSRLFTLSLLLILLAACAGEATAPQAPAPTPQTTLLAGQPTSAPPTTVNSLPTPPVPTAPPQAPVAIGSGSPRLFFSDIESGPNTGGQDNLGAFITIYGEGFGAQRGDSTVTIGGREVARYVIWGEDNAPARNLDLIVIQPGPNVTTGELVVTVNGRASNPLPFTIRPGNIFFVIPDAANADDANSGAFDAPFKTLYRPRKVMQPGDIVYLKGGTFNAADPDSPGWDAVLLFHPDIDPNGTADRPIAYIGYPGDRPVLGAPQPMRRGIYMDAALEYYIIANLELSQYAGTLQPSGNGHRIIGNYSHDGIFSEGAVIGIAGNSARLKIYGNLLRDNGGTGDASGHGLYLQGFGTIQDIDFGWNQIQDQRGRRAIQLFGHADGDRMDNIRIHDNLISGSLRDNILLGGSDGSTEVLGTIYVHNNIIVGADWQGLHINDPQGTFIIQNNVLYNNGSQGPDSNAQLFIERAGAGRITFQNNILYAESGQTYDLFGPGVDVSVFNAASNNLVYNAGDCPDWDTRCINADPLFVDAAAYDFRLQPGSPAIEAGENTGVALDYLGLARPQNQAYDIGAYEFSAPGAAVSLPSVPTVPAVPTQPLQPTQLPSPIPQPTPPPSPVPQPTLPPSASPQPLSGAFHWVALGDSLTEGDGKSDSARRYTELVLARLKAVRPDATLHNVGRSGWTLEQMIADRVPIALNEDPALVTIWIGANDVIYFNPGEDVTASAAAFEQRLDAAVSQILARTRARVIVANLHDISLIPAARGWSEAERAVRHEMTVALNRATANVVQRHADRVSLVDMFNLAALRETSCYADDYHPSDDCEPRIADAWWGVIQPMLR